jgi:membrane associated rhomboid family serine protease
MEAQNLIRVLVIAVLIAIVASLASALLHLSRGGRGNEEESRKLARSLTVRIGLSLALFGLLMLAWYLGLIAPHDALPPGAGGAGGAGHP